MDSSGDAAGIFAILVIFGGPIACAMAYRSWAHKERMAMIERGIIPPQDPRAARRGPYAGPSPVPPPVYEMDYAEWQANRMLHKGIVVAMIGLAITIGLSTIDHIVGFHGPWLLGGLIPLFIGIAQIIIAVLSGARLGAMRMGAVPPGPPPFGQPAPPPPGQAPQDVTPGPYAWRPGATTELQRPPSPPDQR